MLGRTAFTRGDRRAVDAAVAARTAPGAAQPSRSAVAPAGLATASVAAIATSPTRAASTAPTTASFAFATSSTLPVAAQAALASTAAPFASATSRSTTCATETAAAATLALAAAGSFIARGGAEAAPRLLGLGADGGGEADKHDAARDDGDAEPHRGAQGVLQDEVLHNRDEDDAAAAQQHPYLWMRE
jgi:hypothetical protein